MVVDLRSDTVTRPTAPMRRAMADAEVGDSEYGEDPTVNALQDRVATLLGKAAALFTPSGTMANQLALRLLTRPGDTVAAGGRQHIVSYEDGAGPRNAGIGFAVLDDGDGTLAPDAVAAAIAGAAHHLPRVTLVAVEDTHMASGGRVWPEDRMAAVADVATSAGLPVHLDGARLWHAAVASGRAPAAVAARATTVACCMSKGLGAPVGSLLAGPADLIEQARVERHRLGGGMRQAGILAAAGLVALDSMERLAEDHRRAQQLAQAVAERWAAAGPPSAVQTNIVVFSHPDPQRLLDHLAAAGVLAGTVAPGVVRMVTHRDVDDAGIEQACRAIGSAPD